MHLEFSGPCLCPQTSFFSPCQSICSNHTEFSVSWNKPDLFAHIVLALGWNALLPDLPHLNIYLAKIYEAAPRCWHNCKLYGYNSESGRHSLFTKLTV